jgi:hypothetical protein
MTWINFKIRPIHCMYFTIHPRYNHTYHLTGVTDNVGCSFLRDEFLSQLLLDIPNSLPTPTPTPTPTYVPAPEPTPAPTQAPVPAPFPAPLSHLTCHWVSRDDPSRICGAPLSPDPKHACTHLRLAHDVRGNDKVTVSCHWYACRAAPMQRGSVIRHVLAVHLGLLRWQCQTCGKVFSRRGTGHVCNGGVRA